MIDLKTLAKMTIPNSKANYNVAIHHFFIISLIVSIATIFVILSPTIMELEVSGKEDESLLPFLFYAVINSYHMIKSPLVMGKVDLEVNRQPCRYGRGIHAIHTATKARELEVGMRLHRARLQPLPPSRYPLSLPRIHRATKRNDRPRI